MKNLLVLTLILTLILLGCASGEETTTTSDAPTLTVGDGQRQKTYTAGELQALPQAEASFKDIAYIGIPVTALLEDSGFILNDLRAIKATASDGYSVNYDLAQIQKTDVIVAYAQVDGPLAEEDGAFRMVLPEEEGKLNIRMLVDIQAVP